MCEKYLLLGPISQIHPLRGFTSAPATAQLANNSGDGGSNNQAPPQPPRSRRWRRIVGGAAIFAFISWVNSFRRDGKETLTVLNQSLDELDALAPPFSRGKLGRAPLQAQAGSSELSTDPTGAHVDVLDEDRTRGKPASEDADDTDEHRGTRIPGREVTRTFEVYHLGAVVHVCVMEPEDRVMDRPAVVINAGTIAAARPLMLALRSRDPTVTVVAYSHSGLLCQHTLLRGLALTLARRAEEADSDADDDNDDDDNNDDAEHDADAEDAGVSSLAAAVKAGKAVGKARAPSIGDPDIGVAALTACRPPLRPGDRLPTVPLSTLDHESAALAASAMGVTGGVVAAAVAPVVAPLPEPLRRPTEAESGLGGKLKSALGIGAGAGAAASTGIGSWGKDSKAKSSKDSKHSDGDEPSSERAERAKEAAQRDADNTSAFAPGMPAFNRLSVLLQSGGLEPQPGKWLASYPQPFDPNDDYNPLAPLAAAQLLSKHIIGDSNPLASSFVTPPLIGANTPASSDYESSELAAVLAGVGLEKAVLVGFHYNWAATVKTALRNAPRIAGLILVDPLLPPVNPVLGLQMPTETEQLLERASAALAAVEAAKAAKEKASAPAAGDDARKQASAAVGAAWDSMLLNDGLRPSATPFLAQLPLHRNLPPAAAAAWARDILSHVVAGSNGRITGSGGGDSHPSLAEALIEHYAAVDPLTSSVPVTGALILDAAVARSYIVGSGLGPLGTLPAQALLRPTDWRWEKRSDSFGWRRAGTEWRLGHGDTAAAMSPSLAVDLLACGSGQTLPFVTSSKAGQLAAASMTASPALRKAFLSAVGSGAAGLAHQATSIALAHVKGESMANMLVQEREMRAAAAAQEAAEAAEAAGDGEELRSVTAPFAGIVCDGAVTRADAEAAAAGIEDMHALRRAFLSTASATSRLYSSPVTADSTDALSSYVPDHGDMGVSMSALSFTVEMDSEAPGAPGDGSGDEKKIMTGDRSVDHDDGEDDDDDDDDDDAETKKEKKASKKAAARSKPAGRSKPASTAAQLQAEADQEARARGLRALRNVPLHRVIDERHAWLDGHMEGLAAENFLHRTIRDIAGQMDGAALLGKLDARAVAAARAAAAGVRKEAPRLAGAPFRSPPPVLPPALAESLGNVLTTTLAAFAFPESHFTDAAPLTSASPREVQKRAKAAAAKRVDGEGNGSSPVPVVLPPAQLVPQLHGVRGQAARAVLDLQPQQALALAHAGVSLDKLFQAKDKDKSKGKYEEDSMAEAEGWDALTAADALSGRLLHAPGAWTLPIIRVCLARALVATVLDAEPLAYKDAAVEAAEAQVLAAADAFIAAASEKRVPVLNASAFMASLNAYEDAGVDDVQEADEGGKLVPGSPAAALAAAASIAAAAPGRRVLAMHAIPSVPAKASLLTRSPGRDAGSLLLVNSVEDALLALAARRAGLEPYRAHLEPSNFPVPPQLLTSFAEVVDATASPLQVSTPLRPPRASKSRNMRGRRGTESAGAADTDSGSSGTSNGDSSSSDSTTAADTVKRYTASFSLSSGGDSPVKALRQAAEELDGDSATTAAEAAVSALVVRRALAGVAAAARELESHGSAEEQAAVSQLGGPAGMAEKAKAAFAKVTPVPLVRSRGLLAWAATNLAGASGPGTTSSGSGAGSSAGGGVQALPFPVQVLLTELPEGRVTGDPVNGPLTLTTGPGGAFVGANDAVLGTVERDGSTALNGLVGKGKELVPTTAAAGFQLPQIAARPPAPVVAVRRALRSHQLALLQSWSAALPPGVVKAMEAESARDCARELKGAADRFAALGGVSVARDGRILVGGSMHPLSGTVWGPDWAQGAATSLLPESVAKRLGVGADPGKPQPHRPGEPQVQDGARVIPGTHLPVVTGARLSDPLTVLADALAYGGPQPYRPALGRLADEVLSMLPPADSADSQASR